MNKIKMVTRFLPSSIMLRLLYFYRTQHILHLKHPVTFNEKLQWLKLYNAKTKDKVNTVVVDKICAKDYVASIIGKEHIIPTLFVYDSVDEVNWEQLPKQFVIKCNHDSGGLSVCSDKECFDIEKAKEKIRRSFADNFYWHGREWPYKEIKPKILVEEYMTDESNKELKDYKFFCFNGQVKCFKIDFNRFVKHQANYYDINLSQLSFGEASFPPDYNKELDIPGNIHEMIELAEKLASGFPFVRVDLYNINGQIYFGEMTLCPASGFGKFTSDDWDKELGSWLELPNGGKL